MGVGNMPTYRNDQTTRITWHDKNGLEWQPGDIRKCPYFVPHKLLGLTLIDEEPYVVRDPTRGYGYTEIMVGPEPVVWEVPYAKTVEITVVSPEGAVEMYVGDCLTPIIVDPRDNHWAKYPWDMLCYLTFKADSELPVYIKSEPFVDMTQGCAGSFNI